VSYTSIWGVEAEKRYSKYSMMDPLKTELHHIEITFIPAIAYFGQDRIQHSINAVRPATKLPVMHH